jgi:drug/metabolite transporter (DMT)-like permease
VSLVAELEARTPPMAALAVAIVAVSTSAILIRLSGAPSPVKALYRVVFTVLLLAPIAVARHREDFRALSRRDLLFACLSGLALAVHFATWFLSVELTTVAASVTLVQSQPLFVAIGGAVLLDERIGTRKATGIAVALAGMAVMSFGDLLVGANPQGTHTLVGDALAVAGAVAAAGYVLAGRSLRQRVALLPYVTVVYSVCVLGLLAVVLAQGAPLAGYSSREWLLFLAMAVGPGVFGHTVINWALAHVESSVVSVSLLGEPVGSTILALLLLAEVPSWVTVAGGAVVLLGIYVTSSARP